MKQNTEQLKKIREITGKIADLKTQPFTVGNSTHQYVRWDDLLTALLEVDKEIKDYITKTTPSHDEIKREAVREFVDWLKNRDSEDIKCLVCPKCDHRVEYWGHNQEPLYCEKDGRKMVLKTVKERKYNAISIYDLEIELLEEFLTQSKEGGE